MKLFRIPALPRAWSKQEWGWAAVLVLAVLVSYVPVWRAGFVWDDLIVLLQNKSIIGPQGLKEIWTTSAADICPLTMTTFYFEHALWGFAPRPYHVINVALHAASAVALWRVSRHLEIPGAWMGAALWALHPVEVESVAWVIELKNTQSGLFFLLSILFFLKWLKMGDAAGVRNYSLMLVCAFLAMASKSSTVTLPVVLCLCAWWIQRRLEIGMVVRLIPVFFLSAAASALSLWTQHQALADGSDYWVRTWPQRIAAAGDAIWFYLGKLIWPYPLITIYPRWHIDASLASSYLPMLAVIVVMAVLGANASGRLRPWFMAFAYFLVTLLPGLGLFDNIIFRYSLVFDHLQYLASMGPLALIGAGLFKLGQRLSPANPRMRGLLAGGVLVLLGCLSWQRARTFHSDATLWTATLPWNPACWAAYNNLGCDAFNSSDVDLATAYFQKAIALNPNYPDPYRNLETAYQKKGRGDDAIAIFRLYLRVDPEDSSTHFYLGKALIGKGLTDEGFAELEEACRLNPNYAEGHDALGTVYLRKGQIDEAIAQYQKAVAINPKFALGHYNLGLAFIQKGRVDEAIEQYQKSIQLDSTDGKVHNNLGTALAQKGRVDEALAEFQKAVALDPANVEARRNLGSAYLQKRHVDPAIEQYKAALVIDPSDVAIHTFLGLAEGQKGDIPAAIVQFREVLRLKPDDVAVQHYLAKALAMTAGGAK